MKAIETTAIVSADGKLTLQVPPEIQPGEYQVVVAIDEKPLTKQEPPKNQERPPFNFPVINVGSWPADLSLKREDLYE